jgi:LPXTG-motif cell wall-anchored protein
MMQAWGVKGQNCSQNSVGMSTQASQTVCVLALPTGVAGSTQLGEVFLADTFNNHVRAITPGAPPVIPESTSAYLLPISAVLVLGAGFVVLRRRRRSGGAATNVSV